jgi:hypothetical protein
MTITDSGRNLLAAAIKGDKTGGFNAFNIMDVGEGGGNTDVTLNTLDVSLTTNTGFGCTATLSIDNQVEFYAQLSGVDYQGRTIREVGIFDDPPSSAGASMLLRIPIDPIGPIVATKTYDIRIIVEVE